MKLIWRNEESNHTFSFLHLCNSLLANVNPVKCHDSFVILGFFIWQDTLMAITNISWYAEHDHDTMQENFTIQRAKWLNASLKNLFHLCIDLYEYIFQKRLAGCGQYFYVLHEWKLSDDINCITVQLLWKAKVIWLTLTGNIPDLW